MENKVRHELSITIEGADQVATVMELLRKAGFQAVKSIHATLLADPGARQPLANSFDARAWLHERRPGWDTFPAPHIDDVAAAYNAGLSASGAQRCEQDRRELKDIASDWLNDHKHTWSAHDLFTLIRLLANASNDGFELAHESAKCGHARANYRDPNYIRGVSTESDSSKCEFCEALKLAAPAGHALSAEVEAAIQDIEKTHCGCDVMAGWTCNVHERVRRLRNALLRASQAGSHGLPECGCEENRCFGPITGYRCRAAGRK